MDNNLDKQYEQELDRVLGEIRAKLLEKHKRYGPFNLMHFGLFGILVRSSDKLARIENMLRDPQLQTSDETHRDTWIDLAGYAIQALVLFLAPKKDDIDTLLENYNGSRQSHPL